MSVVLLDESPVKTTLCIAYLTRIIPPVAKRVPALLSAR